MVKRFFANLPAFVVTVAKLFLLEFFILFLFKIIFYFGFKTASVAGVDSNTIVRAFGMGMELDMVSTTYALFLPLFLLLLNEFFYKRTLVFNKIAFVSTFVIFSLYALISCADFPYFKQFNSHLNKQAFLWNASPDFILKLIFGNISYYGYLILFLVLMFVIYKILKIIFRENAERIQKMPFSYLRAGIAILLLAPFVIIGARGRFLGRGPVHEGLAIVSDNLFVNQVALNPNFTFFRSVFFQKVKDYSVPKNIDESILFARNYLHVPGTIGRSIAREQKSDSPFKPYNVIIVCMESMSTFKMGMKNHEVLTPYFNSIIKESVYFDRFFSSGIHTFNGLFSTCSGYPGMLTEQSLRRYTKQPFVTLGNLLLAKNYQTYFFSTHDPHFDNMYGFFTQNGYKHTLSSSDLPREKTISFTGVPDHELFNMVISTANATIKDQPFLGFVMTGSDHGPWVIPTDIPFKPDAETEEKRATQYADWALGDFIRNAKKQSWYSNTLFVFLGDHGYSTDDTYEMQMSYNQVPFVLHMPKELKADTCHNLGYQPDVLATVAGVLNLSYTNTTFGENILKERHPFVYFTADDKIGCVSDDGYFFYELIAQNTKRLRKYENLDQRDYYSSNKAKADSLERAAKRMLDAAEYFIRKDYFTY